MDIKPEFTYGEIVGLALALAVAIPVLGFVYSQLIKHQQTRQGMIVSFYTGEARRSYEDSVGWLLNNIWLFSIMQNRYASWVEYRSVLR